MSSPQLGQVKGRWGDGWVCNLISHSSLLNREKHFSVSLFFFFSFYHSCSRTMNWELLFPEIPVFAKFITGKKVHHLIIQGHPGQNKYTISFPPQNLNWGISIRDLKWLWPRPKARKGTTFSEIKLPQERGVDIDNLELILHKASLVLIYHMTLGP